jgi:capsular polysaccharide biosynthesis protein/Mrp family chromosome partitioning ATPase
MNSSTKRDSFELADYLGVLRRRWWIVAALTLVGLLAAELAVKLIPKSYTATASVYVNQLSTDSGRPLHGAGGPVNLDNEAQIVRSQAVAGLVAKRLRPSPSFRQLTSRVEITVPPNTTVLDIACTAPTANGAAACANAVTTAYLAVRLSNAESVLKAALTALQSKADSITQTLGTLSVQLHRHGSSRATKFTRRVEAGAASNELSAVRSQVSALTAELTTLQAPNTLLAGHVINVAVPPTSPSSPKKWLLLPSGLLGGLIVGLLVAFFVDWRRGRLHGASDVERFVDLPVLLNLRREQLGTQSELALGESPAALPFAELAQYMVGAQVDGRLVLLVAGASPDAGVSLVAANLAAALSDAQPDVLLVCAGSGSSMARSVLGAEDHQGLADVLAGQATIHDVVQPVAGVADLRVIGPGTNGGPTLGQRNHDARRSQMAQLRSQARYVIIETPLRSGSSDAFTLTELADAAIVVIETSSTTRSDVKAWLRSLEHLRVPVIGAALTPHLTGAMPPRSRLARIVRRRGAKPEQAGAVVMQAQAAGSPEQRGAP